MSVIPLSRLRVGLLFTFAVLLRVGRKRRAVLRLAHPFLALLHLDRPKSHRHSLTVDAGKGPDEWNCLVSPAG